jgi:hypothetical protein
LKGYLQSLNRPSLPGVSGDRDASTSQKRVHELDQAPETDGRDKKRLKLEHLQPPPEQYSSLRDEVLAVLDDDSPASALENINQYDSKFYIIHS